MTRKLNKIELPTYKVVDKSQKKVLYYIESHYHARSSLGAWSLV